MNRTGKIEALEIKLFHLWLTLPVSTRFCSGLILNSQCFIWYKDKEDEGSMLQEPSQGSQARRKAAVSWPFSHTFLKKVVSTVLTTAVLLTSCLNYLAMHA